jgi:hypothetical protein
MHKTPRAEPVAGGRGALLASTAMQPGEPLWKRAPTRDADGHPLSDFMMVIPGLGRQPQARVAEKVAAMERVLAAYRHAVVFADLNLRLNVLWVSVRPLPGICLELPTALNACVPEAKLVAQYHRGGE